MALGQHDHQLQQSKYTTSIFCTNLLSPCSSAVEASLLTVVAALVDGSMLPPTVARLREVPAVALPRVVRGRPLVALEGLVRLEPDMLSLLRKNEATEFVVFPEFDDKVREREVRREWGLVNYDNGFPNPVVDCTG